MVYDKGFIFTQSTTNYQLPIAIMRLRTFIADSMTEAMAQVKEALGDDALILSTSETKEGVSITAAIDPDADSPPPPRPATPRPRREETIHDIHAVDKLRYDVQHLLRFHNVPELFVSKMLATLNDATIASILGKSRMNIANESRYFLRLAMEHICERYFSYHPLFDEQESRPTRMILMGMPGIGKTLTIAKLATRYVLAGEKTVVITTDTSRAGGADHLRSFTDILGIPLSVCADARSLADEIKLVSKHAHLLVDTAGCNPYNSEELEATMKLVNVGGMEVALAIQAGLDSQEAVDIAEAFNDLPLSFLVATRADCTRRFGNILTIASSNRLPLGLVTDSASVADNVTTLSPKTLVQTLLKPV